MSTQRTALTAFCRLLLASAILTLTGGLATDARAQGYGLRPGDVLQVEVLEDPSLNRSVLVAPDGRISFPQAGSLRASGRTVDAVQSDLITRLTPSFASAPNVFVSLERLAERESPRPAAPDPVISVYVVGEAGTPGKLDVEPGTTALQMFAIMGGFTRFAATKRIQLRRTDANGVETVYGLDYPAIEAGLAPGGLTTMMDGDVIVVPQRRLFE